MLCRCFLVLLMLSVQRVRTRTPISPYFCDSKDKIDEILKPASNFKRFFRYQDQVYFVFKKRVIFGRQPLNDDNTDSKVNSSLVLTNLYEQPNNEPELKDIQIRHDYQVMGYYKNRTGFILEMYAQDGYKERKNKILPVGRQLAFTDVLAERTKTIRLDQVRTNFENRHLMTVVEDAAIVKYADLQDRAANYQLLGKFSYYSNYSQSGRERQNELMIVYSFDVGIHRGVSYHHGIYDFPDLKWFVVYAKEIGPVNVTRIDWFLMIVREKTFDLKFIHFPIFELNKTIEPSDYVKHRVDLTLNYEELFSCHTPFSSERELKGIYYDQATKVFFVFVKRFYLKFEEDLIYHGFYIDPRRYRKAKNIHFESEKLYRSVEFEIINRKWVKAFELNSYLIPNSQTFEIGTDENSDLKLKEVKHNSLLRLCLDQTLVVEKKHVYCFKNELYFYWYDFGNFDYDREGRNYTIESIFEGSVVKWTAGQRLLFIFNYQVDRVVFMTRTHLFVFRYSSFRREENQRITFIAHPEDDPAMPYYLNENCFVVKCTGPVTIKTTMFTVPTTELTTAKLRTTPDQFSAKPSRKPIRLKDIKWYLIGISLLLLIVFIIVCTWYLTRRKRDFKGSLARRFPGAFMFPVRRRRVSPSGRLTSTRASSAYPSSVSQFTTKPQSSFALPSDKQLESIYPASKKWRKNAEKQERSKSVKLSGTSRSSRH